MKPEEKTPGVTPVPVEVQAAAENLMQTAREHGVTVAGFVFASDPLCFMNFGTCNDAHELRLYEALCGIFAKQQERGKVTRVNLARKQ